MKILVFLSCAGFALSAVSDDELWQQFKDTHGRKYGNTTEEQVRFNIFQQNLRTIEKHNKKYDKGEETYYLGVTQFADMSQEEFLSMLTYSQVTKPTLEETDTFDPINATSVPKKINWVKKKAVVGVKNQGQCGSCWAFSATGALEGAHAIKHKSLISLSEQNLVDCSSSYGNSGCNGGCMESAFNYVKDQGIEAEKNYPYKARQESCRYSAKLRKVKVRSYKTIDLKDEALKAAVGTVGPLSISVNADSWQHYKGGIFNEKSCGKNGDHGVLLVGYDRKGSTDYWLIKNSWSKHWGQKGYIKLARDKSNKCGIVMSASYPIVE